MTDQLIIATIAHELGLEADQIACAVQLLDEDNTVPFIARYRKEVTGGLDEEQLRAIQTRLKYLRRLAERKATVLKSIAEQGKLTPELEARIRAAMVLQEVEDLYLPYKPKRRTRATVARERGLEPLAELILAQEITEGRLEQFAQDYLSEKVPTVEDAYAGARDIVAEVVSEDADLRKAVRERTFGQGLLVCTVADASLDPQGKYHMYYEYAEPLKAIPPHRLLAINRGQKEGVLKVKVEAPVDEITAEVQGRYLKNRHSVFAAQVREAAADGYKRLIAPSIERGLRGTCTDEADDHAIKVFAANLRNLLLQPPLRSKIVMGIDPGYRTGCKVTLVDETGKFSGGTTIYPHAPQKQWDEARDILVSLVTWGNVDVIAVGNGTASRETEALAAEVIAESGRGAYTSSTRPARRCTPLPRWPGRNCPIWTSPCAVPSPSPAACKTPWPSWSKSSPAPSAWASTSMTWIRRSWPRPWTRWSSRPSTTWGLTSTPPRQPFCSTFRASTSRCPKRSSGTETNTGRSDPAGN